MDDDKSLNCQTKKIMIVIQCFKFNFSTNDITNLLYALDTKYCCYYYAIKHDLDTDFNGEEKNIHYHIVLNMSCRVRLITILNFVSKFLNCSLDCITIDACPNLIRQVQYLTHQNDTAKYQYLESDIITNDKCYHRFFSEDNHDAIDYEGDIFTLCLYAESRIDVVRAIGLAKYSAFHHAIDVIFNERDKLKL